MNPQRKSALSGAGAYLVGAAVAAALSACAEPLPRGAADEWAFAPDRVALTYGFDGMVSSTDRVASEIGVEVLRRGGNAVDAAVATHFALAVVNPEAGNIGGGGYIVLRMGDGRTASLDFRESAPLAASPALYVDEDGDPTMASRVGHLAAGVPGSVAGMWEAHLRYGSLPWEELVQPAVRLAEGIVVHERLAASLRRHEERLRRHPATAAAFLPGGRAPRVGEWLRQPDLAATLHRIADHGRDGFYRGRTAELIAEEMLRGGGILTREDLERYAALWREPLSFTYRGHEIVSMSPSSSGGATMALILNMLEGYDLQAMGHLSPEHVHTWTEAVKRAFADRNTYLADPDFDEPPTRTMTSKTYAHLRRSEISPRRATPSIEVLPGIGSPERGAATSTTREGENTTHFSIVDRFGNAVALTTTLNSLYGSLVTVAGAGFLLNNEMDDFAVRPGTPNQFGLVEGEANKVAPGKRMLSSMAPTVVLDREGRLKLVTGSPGGPAIITTVAQILSNMIDFDLDLARATAAPRLHHQHLPDVLRYERDGLAPDLVAALRALGHFVQGRPGYSGDAQSIVVLPDGRLIGAADPRRGGAAVAVRDAAPL